MKPSLWDTYWNSPLCTYGIGNTLFKSPVTRTLLIAVDKIFGNIKDKLVMDVGCGNGTISILMALRGAKVIAFDINPLAIRYCRENLSIIKNSVDIKFFVWDAQEKLSIGCNTIDFIFCNQVIEHIPNYEKAIDEMVRVLKCEGKIFITTPNRLTHKTLYRNHLHAFSRDDFRGMIKKRNNVEIEEVVVHNILSLNTEVLYKFIIHIDLFHRLLQKATNRIIETVYILVTKPLVVFYNSFVYPSVSSDYLRKEKGINDNTGSTVYLVLRKLEGRKNADNSS